MRNVDEVLKHWNWYLYCLTFDTGLRRCKGLTFNYVFLLPGGGAGVRSTAAGLCEVMFLFSCFSFCNIENT